MIRSPSRPSLRSTNNVFLSATIDEAKQRAPLAVLLANAPQNATLWASLVLRYSASISLLARG
jgi:hypothetical protein